MSCPIKVEVCACTKCSMVGAMEIFQDVSFMQSQLTDMGDLKYNIDLVNICRSDLHESGHASPLVFVNGTLYEGADAATIMEAIAVQSIQGDTI